MQTSKFWNRFYLSGRKISLFFLLLFVCIYSYAQDEKMNNLEHDNKFYYFGISIGMNAAQYKINQSSYFSSFDSIKNITPIWKPGFQVGILGNLRLSSFVDLRLTPLFVIREKAIRFDYLNDSTLNHSVESVLFNLPVEFKFKSERQTNFRFYVLAGGKLDFDFNANARSKRPDEIIKFKPLDFGYNLGLGFEFYYPNFIFSPEIKISNGLGNVLLRNTDEPTNKALDRLSTRMIYISFLIQG